MYIPLVGDHRAAVAARFLQGTKQELKESRDET